MARSSLPTSPDTRFNEAVQFQHLWVELGQGAAYAIGAAEGDCSVIEIEVAQDLANGVPYNTGLKLGVALIRDNVDTQALAVDELLDLVGEKDVDAARERITMVDCVEAIAREGRTTHSPPRMTRIELNCVNIRLHPKNPDVRILMVHPIIDPAMLGEDRWLLEIKLGDHDLVRRIASDRPTLIPSQS